MLQLQITGKRLWNHHLQQQEIHQNDIDFEEKLEIKETDLQNYSEDVEEEMELANKAIEINNDKIIVNICNG